MPTFIKKILVPGKYLVQGEDGKRVPVEFTPDRIKGWVDRFKEMQAAGLRNPAPFDHHPDAIPSVKGKKSSAFNNAGYWTDYWQDPTTKALYGKLQAPDVKDSDKIGTSVVEVSPSIRTNFTDGTGKVWEGESLLHTALVIHPVIPGQENFTRTPSSLTSETLALSLDDLCEAYQLSSDPPKPPGKPNPEKKMGEAEEEDGTEDPFDSEDEGDSFQDVLECLASLGLVLPEDTTESNLCERIRIATKAIQGTNGDKDPQNQGQGNRQIPDPIVMSLQLGTKPMPLNDAQSASLIDTLKTGIKTEYTNKITGLVGRAVVSKDYAEKTLTPMVETIQLSLDDAGKITVVTPLDAILLALGNLPNGMSGERNPKNGDTKNLSLETPPDGVTGEGPTKDEILKNYAKTVGRPELARV